MGQAAFHPVIGLLSLQDLELLPQLGSGAACGGVEQGNELSGGGKIVGAARETLREHFLTLVALHQQVGR